jgi:DNA-binding beta-propeller fold protein YncE
MMKRGVNDLGVIVILLIISHVFGGVVSAVDVSEDFIGSVAYAPGSHGNDNIILDEEYSDSVLAMVTAGASAETEYTFVTMWPELPQPWYFNGHSYIAVDSSGYVYVADIYNYRIQKFDADGNFITKWGSEGTGDGQFYGPNGIAVDSRGNVYVADSYNNRIQKFDSNGNFITKWGSEGTGDSEFYYP